MEISDSADLAVVREAERVVFREKWRLCEQRAADNLARTWSLRWTRLFPESPIIQIVAIDGVVIGQVRYDGIRWIALGTGTRGPVARCAAFRDALLTLVCEATR